MARVSSARYSRVRTSRSSSSSRGRTRRGCRPRSARRCRCERPAAHRGEALDLGEASLDLEHAEGEPRRPWVPESPPRAAPNQDLSRARVDDGVDPAPGRGVADVGLAVSRARSEAAISFISASSTSLPCSRKVPTWTSSAVLGRRPAPITARKARRARRRGSGVERLAAEPRNALAERMADDQGQLLRDHAVADRVDELGPPPDDPRLPASRPTSKPLTSLMNSKGTWARLQSRTKRRLVVALSA